MKRIALLAVIGAGLMALPSTAAAQSGATHCPSNVEARVDGGSELLYVCFYERNTGLGGQFVLGRSTPGSPTSCSYVNGWSTNPEQGRGYAGLCTGATSRGPGCNPDGHAAGGANTGGCFAIKPPAPAAVNEALNTFPVGLVTASFICGNTTGEDPQNTTRRGCAIP